MPPLCTTFTSSLSPGPPSWSSCEMTKPASISFNCASENQRIRPEWEVVDLESGICTTHVYLYPDEVNLEETSHWISINVAAPDTTLNTTPPNQQQRRQLFRSHSLSTSSSPANSLIHISSSEVDCHSIKDDISLRPKVTSCLRGDAMSYVPHRLHDTENLGHPPSPAAIPSSKATSSVRSSTLIMEDLTKDISTLNYFASDPVPSSPTIHTSTLMDAGVVPTAIPRPPRNKYIQTYKVPELPFSVSRLSPHYHRRVQLPFELPVPAKALKPINPYISTSRVDGSLLVKLKYNTLPIYSVTDETGSGSATDDPQKQGMVGPYRSAAIWEIIGQTFAKPERYKKLKLKRKRGVRDSLERTTPRSNLSKAILTDETSEKVQQLVELEHEWGKVTSSTCKHNWHFISWIV